MRGAAERTESQHRLVDLTGGLLAQQARVVALDGEQGHDPWKKGRAVTSFGSTDDQLEDTELNGLQEEEKN